ncbi:unnamed protein product, partial [Heterosigma akashiwo]
MHLRIVAVLSAAVVRERCDWEKEAQLSLDEGDFFETYRMSKESFDILLKKLEPSIQGEWNPRWHGTGRQITPALKLAATIRWLAGGCYRDIRRVFGFSERSFYRHINSTIDAINALDDRDLNIHFPRDHGTQWRMAADFEWKSSHGVHKGCGGCLDGLLVEIKQPSARESDAPSKYFSGHYHKNGLNVQAMCDVFLKFTFAAIKCPGSTSDSMALLLSSFSLLLLCLAPGLYILADAAYSDSDTLLTPFSGRYDAGTPEDTFKFYLSQLRVRVDMAFGYSQPNGEFSGGLLKFLLPEPPKLIVLACMKLHNFCINRTMV